MKTINFDNLEDLQQYLRSISKKEKVSIKTRPDGVPMPKLIEFLKKSKAPENWTTLESFMVLNGKEVDKPFHTIQNKKLLNENFTTYRNGLLFEKKGDHIIFTSYTIDQKTCVFNNISKHKFNGNLLSGTTNMFQCVSSFDDDLLDGKDYLDNMLDSMLGRIDTFKWNIVK